MKKIVNQKDINYLINTDYIFHKIYDRYGVPPNWVRAEGFITLSGIIIGQQVSLESADAHFLKLSNYLPEFSPEEILKLSDIEMRRCQITRQKSGYLRSLSLAIIEKRIDLKKLSGLKHSEVRETLKLIKGIGDWTADIYLMFSLQAKDIFPIGDVAVIKTIKELTNNKTKDGIISRSEKWKPCRSLATYFLWHYYLNKRKRIFKP